MICEPNSNKEIKNNVLIIFMQPCEKNNRRANIGYELIGLDC